MRLALAGICCLLLVVGCGPVQDSAPSKGQTADTTTDRGSRPAPLLEFEGDAPLSVIWLTENTADRKPIKDLYSVFRRPQTRREAEVASDPALLWACSLPSSSEDMSRAGKPISGGTRILLREIGPKNYELVATPTTRDAVGFGLFPDGGGSCGAPMPDGLDLAAQLEHRSAVVYGLVGDDVIAVDLVIDGAKHGARLGENGFALAIPDATGKALEQIVLHRKDGSATEIP